MTTLVKVFTGEYDLFHRAALHAEFDALSTDSRPLVLDMSAVTYLDSSFARELIRLHDLRAGRGYEQMTIVRVAPIVKRVFKLLFVDTFCRMVDTLEEALPKEGKPIVLQLASRGGDAMGEPWALEAAQPAPSAWIARVLSIAGV